MMKILYISYLVGGGPNWSVPASIKAQSKIDDVFWINMTDTCMEHWLEVEAYHTIHEIGQLTLNNLPEKFRKPDLVVFEGTYFIKNILFSYTLRKKHIPYIIVPRSSLTIQAQNNSKWLKKRIFNFLIFNSFIKNALAVQYLTEDELKDSSTKWNKNYFIVSNGVVLPDNFKTDFFNDNKMCGLFIGRIDIYQKGLDLLVDACCKVQNELRDNNIIIKVYGPDYNGDKLRLQDMLTKNEIDDIIEVGDVIMGKAKETILLESDFFVMTSRFEGHPMALIEALSHGLPCLVSQGTNMRKEICGYDAGWGCDDTSNDICAALLKVKRDKHKFLDKSKNARSLASKYDWNNLAREFHDSVDTLLMEKYQG